MISVASNKSRFSLSNIWMILLLYSFSYDKPIITLTAVDRFNPRLIDFALLLGLIWFFSGDKINTIVNPVYKYYKRLIFVFIATTFLSMMVYNFPSFMNGYSLYYLVKYIQELLICFLFIQFLSRYNVDYDTILKCLIIGGIFVFLYSLNEFFADEMAEIEIAPGKYVQKPFGLIWGPYTISYFQLANYSPIISFIALTYGLNHKGIERVIYVTLACLISLPSFFCGSRTAFGFILVLLMVASLFNKKYRYFLGGFVLVISLILLFNIAWFKNFFITDNQTVDRLTRMENMESLEFNSVLGRLMHLVTWFKMIPYYALNGVFMPVVGAGFYVAPIHGSFRIGYGWHNIFIFAIEQSGIFGFFFFIKFLKKTHKILNLQIGRLSSISEESIVFSSKIIFYAIIIMGVFGAHSFWLGFATGNFNTLRLLLFLLSSHIIISNLK